MSRTSQIQRNTGETDVQLSLDLDGTGAGSASQHIVKVADISTTTNNEAGLTLTATSGALTPLVGTAIDFQVAATADSVAAVIGDFTFASGIDFVDATIPAGTVLLDLSIMYTPLDFQSPGAYDGQIDLTVSDN